MYFYLKLFSVLYLLHVFMLMKMRLCCHSTLALRHTENMGDCCHCCSHFLPIVPTVALLLQQASWQLPLGCILLFPSILEGCPALVNVTLAIFSPPDDDCVLLFPRVHQLLLEAPFLSATFQKLDSSELRFSLIWFLRHLLRDVTDWRPAQLYLASTIVGIRWGVQQEEKWKIKIRFRSWRFRLVGSSFRTWRKSYWESCTLKFIRAASTDGRCKRTTIRHQCDWKILNTTTFPKRRGSVHFHLVFSVCSS